MQDPVSVLIITIVAIFSSFIDTNRLSNVEEIRCMADNIFFEGRGESIKGQIAIGLVTMNRVNSNRFPNSVCNVVKQGPIHPYNSSLPKRHKCQFSWWCDGKPDRIDLLHPNGKKKGKIIEPTYTAYIRAVRNAILVLGGAVNDFTSGATFYYAHNLVTPKWAKSDKLKKVMKIDNHTFMKFKK